jgi:hypothetical protein
MKPSDVKSIEDAKKIIAERDAEYVTIGSPDLQVSCAARRSRARRSERARPRLRLRA